MQTNAEGICYHEGDPGHIKRTGEQGKIKAIDGGVVSVLVERTNQTRLFSASVDEDGSIEL